jgi:hypothetical protein
LWIPLDGLSPCLAQDVIKLIDCYVGEGPKILIRFGIALVSLAMRSRPSTAGAITTGERCTFSCLHRGVWEG